MEIVTPDFGLLFWQVITFVGVFFVLSKFAWKPIMSGLKEREQGIESALSEAKRAKEEMALLTADNQKLILEARKERDKMLDEAQHMASNLIQEAKEKANIESQRLVDAARAEIEISKQAALAELKNHLASTSLAIAEKVIRRNLSTDASQQELVKELLATSKN